MRSSGLWAAASTVAPVARAARRGDGVAARILRSTGKRLGAVLAILVDILNPERIVIGGLAMRLGDPFGEGLETLAAQRLAGLPDLFEVGVDRRQSLKAADEGTV